MHFIKKTRWLYLLKSSIILFFFLIITYRQTIASEEKQTANISISDSASYAYIGNKLLKEEDFDMLYKLINDHYRIHWSTNLILIKELSKTDLKKMNPKTWGNIKIVEGNIWNTIDDRNSAYHCYMEAKEVFESIGDDKGKALVLLNLAQIPNASTTELDPAKNMLNIAAAIFIKHKDSINTFKCYNNIAVQYLNRKSIDSVMFYLKKAEHFLPLNDFEQLKAIVDLNKGEFYMLIGELELSDSCYFAANTILHKLNYNDALAYSYLQLGLNAKKNQPYKAINYFEKSLTYSDKTNEKSNKIIVYEELGKIYNYLEDYKNASHYFQKTIDLNQYLKSTEVKEKEELLKLHLEINEKSEHISSLSFEKEILKRNARAIGFVSAILLLMGIVIIFLMRAQVKKKKILIQQTKDLSESKHLLIKSQLENERLQKDLIEEELNNKSNQVSSFAMQLVKKNEFMQRLQNEIKILRKDVKNDTVLNEIQRIIVNISQNIDAENNLIEFSMQVNKANQEFYTTLDQLYPNLTKTEKQILGFLKINMTSKEIASILNISLQGVNTKRYRLRKKLGLDNSISFSDFIGRIK